MVELGREKEKRTPTRERIGHELNQTDEYTSVPIPSMSCEEKQPETESPGSKITSDEWEVPVERVKSTCTKARPDQAIDSSCATTSSMPSLGKIATGGQNKTEA